MGSIDLKGTGVAIITPFREDKSIDFNALDKLVEFQINQGIDYLVVMGTTGESVTLNKEEKNAVLSYIKEKTDNRIPIVYGIGGNNTNAVISEIKAADFKGVSALLSVVPYYNKPSQEGLFQHYKTIASASPVPVILYNVPGRTSANMEAQTTLRLAKEVENIIAVKEASGNFSQVMEIINNRPDGFLVISGDDAITLPMIAAGGDGVVSVIANAYPKDFSQMVSLALSGDFENARKKHYELLPIINAIFEEGSPTGIKALLSLKGMINNSVRLPLTQASDDLVDYLKSII